MRPLSPALKLLKIRLAAENRLLLIPKCKRISCGIAIAGLFADNASFFQIVEKYYFYAYNNNMSEDKQILEESGEDLGTKSAKTKVAKVSHVARKAHKKKRKRQKIADAIFGNPLFWILVMIGALLLFIALFEHVPQFGVNKVYHIFD